jgi:hypothetical protein
MLVLVLCLRRIIAVLSSPGWSLGLEVGTHVRPEHRVERGGGVFDRDRVTRVTRLGYTFGYNG